MAKNSIDAYGAKGKSNVLFFDPEALHLVTDELSPLFDKRVHLPVDEKMVLNVMHQGVVQPITVNKNTETGLVEVVAGRQRVKAAREANLRLVAQGREPITVPAIPRRGDELELASVMVSENEIRTDDTPMGRAAKMRKLTNLGQSEASLAVVFGVGVQTIRDTLALLDCCADVRNAVDAGKIGAGHARKLAALEPDAQRKVLAELVAAGDGVKPHERARKQRAIVDPAKPRARSLVEIRNTLKGLTDQSGDIAKTLRWVLGMAES